MIRIGTRTSKLAMIQTELVKQKIQEHFPKEKIETKQAKPKVSFDKTIRFKG